MRQGLSKQQIFDMAKRRTFWVEKYRYGSTNLRKKVRRMVSDGVLKIVINTKDQYGVRASVAQLAEPLI